VSFVQPFTPGRTYFLDKPTRLIAPLTVPRPDDVVINKSAARLTLSTGPAQFEFTSGGFPDRVWLDMNGNRLFEPDEILSDNAGQAFYVERIDGRRGFLRNTTISIETPKPGNSGTVYYSVVKVAGEYLDAQTGGPIAAGTVYYHFYGREARFRLDHKFIITDHGAGFTGIGMTIPVAVQSNAFGVVEDTSGNEYTTSLASGTLEMIQLAHARFNETGSRCYIRDRGALAQNGATCGSWTDLYGLRNPRGKWGLGVQVPGFAQQFPKAFEIGAQHLQVELWSTKEGAPPLSFATPDLFQNYFGRWMNAAPGPWARLKSANGGVAKTHEIWV
jgi:hypothetical protein